MGYYRAFLLLKLILSSRCGDGKMCNDDVAAPDLTGGQGRKVKTGSKKLISVDGIVTGTNKQKTEENEREFDSMCSFRNTVASIYV